MVVKLIIDRIEEQHAVCITQLQEKIIVPLSCMPDDVEEGSAVFLEIRVAENTNEFARAHAKEVLNELIMRDTHG